MSADDVYYDCLYDKITFAVLHKQFVIEYAVVEPWKIHSLITSNFVTYQFLERLQ